MRILYDMNFFSQLLNFLLFADDTNIFAFDRDVHLLFKNVNEELHSLSNWFRANKLSLNIKKTNFTLFSKCHQFSNHN